MRKSHSYSSYSNYSHDLFHSLLTIHRNFQTGQTISGTPDLTMIWSRQKVRPKGTFPLVFASFQGYYLQCQPMIPSRKAPFSAYCQLVQIVIHLGWSRPDLLEAIIHHTVSCALWYGVSTSHLKLWDTSRPWYLARCHQVYVLSSLNSLIGL